MEPVLGPDGPARDHQGTLFADHRIGMDNPEVDPGHPGRIRTQTLFMSGDWDFGGHVDEELRTYVQ
jgi:hypothetical protein